MIGAGVGIGFRRRLGAAVAIPDFYDTFTEVSNTELNVHVMSPLPSVVPPAWVRSAFSDVTFRVNTSGEVVIGNDATGSFAGYSFDCGVVANKLTFETYNASSLSSGFLIRMDLAATTGVYFIMDDNGVTGIAIRPYNYADDVALAAAQTMTGPRLTTLTEFTVEDLGTSIKIYPSADPANFKSFAVSTLNTQTGVGVFCSEGVTTVKWKNFKAYIPAPSTLSLANYPSVVSAFPVTPAASVDGTDHTNAYIMDVQSGLTIPMAQTSPTLNQTNYTVAYAGTGNEWFDNFRETNAAVKALLDGPSTASPVMLILSGKWKGGGEAYGMSAGYGDWKNSVGDFLYSGHGPLAQQLQGDAKVGGINITAPYAGGYPPSVIAVPVWSSQLVIIDPATSRITFKYLAEAPATTIQTFTATGAAFTQPFTFLAVGYQLTVHALHLAFMGLCYPNVLPTDEQANQILTHHFRNHQAKRRILHNWFDGRAKHA